MSGSSDVRPGTSGGPAQMECGACRGAGTSSFVCFFCKGTGKSGNSKCTFCEGRMFSKCSSCNGTGRR